MVESIPYGLIEISLALLVRASFRLRPQKVSDIAAIVESQSVVQVAYLQHSLFGSVYLTETLWTTGYFLLFLLKREGT